MLQALEWVHCSHPAFVDLASDQCTVRLVSRAVPWWFRR